MSVKGLQCATMLLVVAALAACSNGSGSLANTPAASPGQAAAPENPTPTPAPTPPPTPTPTPTPTPPPPQPPPPTPTPPPPTPTPPTNVFAGYWFGTVKAKSGRSYDGRAIVAADGNAQLIVTGTGGLTASPELVVYGEVCCASKVDVELKAVRYLSERVSEAPLQAEIKSGVLTGKFKIRSDEYEFSLDRLGRYDESVTLADLAGTYTRTITVFLGPSSTYTVTLDADGRLTGSNTNGCVYNGTASLPDAPRNLVKLAVELSNCPNSITGSGSMNGTYSGLGVLLKDTISPRDPSQRSDVLFHSLIGRTWLGPQPVER